MFAALTQSLLQFMELFVVGASIASCNYIFWSMCGFFGDSDAAIGIPHFPLALAQFQNSPRH